MTDRQRKFADEYIICGNATEAYRCAYPRIKSDAVASAAAARLLRKVSLRAYVDAKLDEISSQKTASAKEVMEYLTSVLRGEAASEVVVVEGIGDGCSEARRVKKAPDEKERLKAAELLGKRYGIFTDRIDLTQDIVLDFSGDGADGD